MAMPRESDGHIEPIAWHQLLQDADISTRASGGPRITTKMLLVPAVEHDGQQPPMRALPLFRIHTDLPTCEVQYRLKRKYAHAPFIVEGVEPPWEDEDFNMVRI